MRVVSLKSAKRMKVVKGMMSVRTPMRAATGSTNDAADEEQKKMRIFPLASPVFQQLQPHQLLLDPS